MSEYITHPSILVVQLKVLVCMQLWAKRSNVANNTKSGCMIAILVVCPLKNNPSCCLQGLHNNVFGSTEQITIFQIFSKWKTVSTTMKDCWLLFKSWTKILFHAGYGMSSVGRKRKVWLVILYHYYSRYHLECCCHVNKCKS